jgi:cytochrome bd ubiquinol oxidase subunit I
MALDPVLLSRLQWAWVIAWHILLPAFTVGLAAYVAVLEGLHLITGREAYARISTFWTKIFAVSFAMGVVSGIMMPFQFGTNWSRFTDATANIISPMMAYEAFLAFALEASFLGILCVGRLLLQDERGVSTVDINLSNLSHTCTLGEFVLPAKAGIRPCHGSRLASV